MEDGSDDEEEEDDDEEEARVVAARREEQQRRQEEKEAERRAEEEAAAAVDAARAAEEAATAWLDEVSDEEEEGTDGKAKQAKLLQTSMWRDRIACGSDGTWRPPVLRMWRPYPSFSNLSRNGNPMSDPQGPLDALRHALPGKRAEELPCFWDLSEADRAGMEALPVHLWHGTPSGVCAVVMHRARDFREEVNRVTAAGAAAEEEGEDEDGGGNSSEATTPRAPNLWDCLDDSTLHSLDAMRTCDEGTRPDPSLSLYTAVRREKDRVVRRKRGEQPQPQQQSQQARTPSRGSASGEPSQQQPSAVAAAAGAAAASSRADVPPRVLPEEGSLIELRIPATSVTVEQWRTSEVSYIGDDATRSRFHVCIVGNTEEALEECGLEDEGVKWRWPQKQQGQPPPQPPRSSRSRHRRWLVVVVVVGWVGRQRLQRASRAPARLRAGLIGGRRSSSRKSSKQQQDKQPQERERRWMEGGSSSTQKQRRWWEGSGSTQQELKKPRQEAYCVGATAAAGGGGRRSDGCRLSRRG